LVSPNASISTGPNSFGDTSHGWSAPGALGSISCSGSSGVACTSCGSCQTYTNICDNPYGGEWSLSNTSYTSGYTYFLDGSFSSAGGPGPVPATLITTGQIGFTGNSNFSPVMKAAFSPLQPPFTNPRVQFMIGSDFYIRGTPADSVNF